jgi:TIR domain
MDIRFGDSFIEAIHDGITNARHLIILFTHDYLQSPYTRKEFTSFEAQRLRSLEERHILVLLCEDAPLVGLLSDNVYQNLVGITDADERKRRIIAVAERQSQAAAPPPRPFIEVPPRIASFTGRLEELNRLDAILMHDKPAAVTQAVGRVSVTAREVVGLLAIGRVLPLVIARCGYQAARVLERIAEDRFVGNSLRAKLIVAKLDRLSRNVAFISA